jgi:hypothetical protein
MSVYKEISQHASYSQFLIVSVRGQKESMHILRGQ